MIFIFGISSGQKEFDYEQSDLCDHCGRYGYYQIIMKYMSFTLFFIPIFKWNKRYYCLSSCCHSIYHFDDEKGRQLLKGYDVTITKDDLELIEAKSICSNCGFETNEDYQFCPKCANKL